MTTAHAQLQEDLNRIQASLESHQRGMEESKEAHAKATDALAEMRAAKVADDSVLLQVKEELANKEQLLSQAMTDLQATAQNKSAEVQTLLHQRQQDLEVSCGSHVHFVSKLTFRLPRLPNNKPRSPPSPIKPGSPSSRPSSQPHKKNTMVCSSKLPRCPTQESQSCPNSSNMLLHSRMKLLPNLNRNENKPRDRKRFESD